jgi:IS605 OrfB family transposase
MPVKTLKVRLKDRHATVLSRMAREVNFVWNYLNELSSRSIRERGVFLSGYDLDAYTKGASRELGINSQTVQAISAEYTVRRKQFRKARLSWRKSGGVRRSLGWIPVKGQTVRYQNGQIVYNGHHFKLWDSYGLSKYKFRQGNFSEDSRGRWYFNIAVEFEAEKSKATGETGIDLGLKDTAVGSDGTRLEAGRFYRGLEDKLAVAQRANKKHLVKSIHAKMKNKRNDATHKYTRSMVNENALIVVGNVSSSTLAKTRMAKSVYDAGWYMVKTQLDYKCAHAGGVFIEVSESNTTQTCSCCGSLSPNSPKGRAGLGIREWTCDSCGEHHDRDINAARNILALGRERLAVGIPVL